MTTSNNETDFPDNPEILDAKPLHLSDQGVHAIDFIHVGGERLFAGSSGSHVSGGGESLFANSRGSYSHVCDERLLADSKGSSSGFDCLLAAMMDTESSLNSKRFDAIQENYRRIQQEIQQEDSSSSPQQAARLKMNTEVNFDPPPAHELFAARQQHQGQPSYSGDGSMMCSYATTQSSPSSAAQHYSMVQYNAALQTLAESMKLTGSQTEESWRASGERLFADSLGSSTISGDGSMCSYATAQSSPSSAAQHYSMVQYNAALQTLAESMKRKRTGSWTEESWRASGERLFADSLGSSSSSGFDCRPAAMMDIESSLNSMRFEAIQENERTTHHLPLSGHRYQPRRSQREDPSQSPQQAARSSHQRLKMNTEVNFDPPPSHEISTTRHHQGQTSHNSDLSMCSYATAQTSSSSATQQYSEDQYTVALQNLAESMKRTEESRRTVDMMKCRMLTPQQQMVLSKAKERLQQENQHVMEIDTPQIGTSSSTT